MGKVRSEEKAVVGGGWEDETDCPIHRCSVSLPWECLCFQSEGYLPCSSTLCMGLAPEPIYNSRVPWASSSMGFCHRRTRREVAERTERQEGRGIEWREREDGQGEGNPNQ